jgi:hypothetical protein
VVCELENVVIFLTFSKYENSLPYEEIESLFSAAVVEEKPKGNHAPLSLHVHVFSPISQLMCTNLHCNRHWRQEERISSRSKEGPECWHFAHKIQVLQRGTQGGNFKHERRRVGFGDNEPTHQICPHEGRGKYCAYLLLSPTWDSPSRCLFLSQCSLQLSTLSWKLKVKSQKRNVLHSANQRSFSWRYIIQSRKGEGRKRKGRGG